MGRQLVSQQKIHTHLPSGGGPLRGLGGMVWGSVVVVWRPARSMILKQQKNQTQTLHTHQVVVGRFAALVEWCGEVLWWGAVSKKKKLLVGGGRFAA